MARRSITKGLSVSASLLLHLAFLVGGLAILPAPSQEPVAQEVPVVVDISNISEKTAIKAETKQEVPKQEKPKAEKSEVTKDVQPAPKVDEKVVEAAKEKTQKAEKQPEPEKKPEDQPVDDKKLEELLAEQVAAEQKLAEEAALAEKKKQEQEEKKKEEDQKKKQAEAKKKEADDKRKKAEEEKKKKQKLDVAELTKLLNKENEERTSPKKASDTSGNPDQGLNEIQGDEAQAKASFRDALVAKIKQCFRPPPASLDDNIRIKVTLLINLNPDGSLKGTPQPQFTGVPLADAVAQAASSAVVECQPYNFFPPGKYKGYSSWEVEFDPKEM